MRSGKQLITVLLLAFGLLAPWNGTALAEDEDERLIDATPAASTSDDGRVRDRQQKDGEGADRQQFTGEGADRQQFNRDGDGADRQQFTGEGADRQQFNRESEQAEPQPKDRQQFEDEVVAADRQPEIEDRQQKGTDDGKPARTAEPSFDDINQGAPDTRQKGGTDNSLPIDPGFALPERHGPPGRGPRGDVKWELVDGDNQGGTKEAREALARELFGTGIGFSPQDLRAATRAELADILIWLEDALKREKDFADNLSRTAKKIERKKKDMARMSLGELYKERVGGWFDHQKDADDMRVAMDFKRFLQDRANRPGAERGNIYRLLLQDVDHLIMLSAPAYGVSISKEEIRSVKKVEAKFRDGKNKGVFQFPASYVMGLMLDRHALRAAIESKSFARRPRPGKGGDYGSDPWVDQADQWGRDQGGDIDVGYGKGGGKPRSPGYDDGYGPRRGKGGDSVDRDLRRVMGQTARVGTAIFDANDRHAQRMTEIDREYDRRRKEMDGGPMAPSGNVNEAGIERAIKDADGMLDQVRERQRAVVNLISQWRQAQDPVAQRNLEANIRGLAYGGSDPNRPSPDSLIGMLNSPRLKQALAYANRGAQSGNPAFQSAASRIFGAGGKLDRIQRTQHEVVGQFLRDRDQDRRGKGDPNDPLAGDPNRPVYGPDGRPLPPGDPRRNGPGAPDDGRFGPGVRNTGSPLPGGGNPQVASDPNQRLQQVTNALQDPNLTPAERANLQAEQQRLQQQIQKQQQAAAAATAANQPTATTAGTTAQGPRAPVSAADAEAAAKAKMPNVPNTYGISPPALTDDELRAAAAPVIQAEVAKMNEQLKARGMTVNEYLQYSGKGVQSTGRPPGDHVQMWIQRFPGVRAAMEKAAQEAHARKLKELTTQEMARVQTAPAPTVQNPAAVATPLPSQVGSGPAGAIVEPR
ncbi:MAG: hypothetical protein HY816_19265 [Candidatus Wallbacteria bacterium]|nr:hypothetical protein [Candidatus Wallbacteria bacterium]